MAIKATVILPYRTGLAADVTVNTWYSNAQANETGITELGTFIDFLYNNADDGASLSSLLSGYIDRDNALLRFVEFNPMTGKEISQAVETPFVIDAPINSTNLPNEVAVCLSYKSGFSTVNKGRNRGRVFLGPFNGSMNSGTSNNASRPRADYYELLVTRAKVGADDMNNGGADLSLYSPTDHALKPISSFSIDNEWDTQRRRGLLPTASYSLALVPPV